MDEATALKVSITCPNCPSGQPPSNQDLTPKGMLLKEKCECKEMAGSLLTFLLMRTCVFPSRHYLDQPRIFYFSPGLEGNGDGEEVVNFNLLVINT